MLYVAWAVSMSICAFGQEPALPGVASPHAVEPLSLTPKRQMFSVSAGLIRPMSRVGFGGVNGGGSASNGDTGFQIGGQWLYLPTPNLGAGLEIDYADRTGSISPRLFPNSISSAHGDSWLMLGVLRGWLPRIGRARPFVLGGAGYAYNTLSVDVRASNWADTNTQETRRLVDDARWTPAASARLGLDFEVPSTRGGIFTVEAGWLGLAGAKYSSTPQGAALGILDVSAPLNVLAFSARYGWRF